MMHCNGKMCVRKLFPSLSDNSEQDVSVRIWLDVLPRGYNGHTTRSTLMFHIKLLCLCLVSPSCLSSVRNRQTANSNGVIAHM